MANYKDIKGTTVQVKSATQPTTYPQLAGELYYNSSNGDYEFLGLGTGTWASGGSLNTARYLLGGAGTQTAGLAIGGHPPSLAIAEEYDGTSWTESGDLNLGRRYVACAGTQTAAIAMAGYADPTPAGYTNDAETYNGSTWSEITDLTTARASSQASAGTQTAAVTFGGNNPGAIALTEEWDGSSWTESGDLNTARADLAGCGQQTEALAFGGSPGLAATESYNGSTWTAGNDLNTGRHVLTGSGNSAPLALAIGGNGDVAITEQFDGTSWTEVGDMSTARDQLSSAVHSGVGATAAFGGHTSTHVANTEEWTITHAVKTVTTS